ncbi:MAG: arsenite methyltransferase [Chloroflexota bacterium]
MANEASTSEIVEAVREHYAAAARQAQTQKESSCCGGSNPTSQRLYDISQLREIPDGAALASLGCGNPTLLAQLQPGEVVLDLGSGGGIDVLLSAKRVGPTGKAYGLDMTDEMLALARNNARESGAENVEFLKGRIESIPLPDSSVDVIISNCVINLSADKDAVLKEAFRVLKPGGRFAVADIVVKGAPLPPEAQRLLALWASCIAGALTEDEYCGKLTAAGFGEVEMTTLQTYGAKDIPAEVACCVPENLGFETDSEVISAFIRAKKG